MLTTQSQLGLSCPDGGRWYVCQGNTTQFLGCCKSDPCKGGKGVCPTADLAKASFSADLFDEIPPQNCSSSSGAGNWFTCKKTSPPFMGCCKNDPCGNGCSQANLIPARLSENKTNAAVFMTTPASSTPTSTSSTPTASALPPQSSGSSGLSAGVIAGIAIGAVAIVAVIAFFLVWRLRRRREDRESRVIAHFPASYIPNALPDMSPHKAEAFKASDDSRRNSFVSTVTPAGTASHHHTPSDPRHFSVQSMMMNPDHQGQYARVANDPSPDHSPRFGPVPEEQHQHQQFQAAELEGGGSAAAAAAGSGQTTPPRRQVSPPQSPPRLHPYSQRFVDMPDPYRGASGAAGSEYQETAPLTGSDQQPRWKPYRPS